MSIIPAILIQAVLFGLYHFNLVQMVFTIPLGILYGFLVWWTKSIWGAIIMHGVNNALSFMLTRFEKGAYLEHYYVLLPLSLFITAALIIYFYIKRQNDGEKLQASI